MQKMVGGKLFTLSPDEEAAVRAEWADSAVDKTLRVEERAAGELGKWYDRKRRNAQTRTQAPARYAAALDRLDAECDENIQRLEAAP